MQAQQAQAEKTGFRCRVVALVAVASLFAPSPGAQQLSPRVEKLRTQAEQGDRSAQSILGRAYYYGRGVPQDYAEGARWYRMAAEQGDASAQNNLGMRYHNGQGVPQDHAEAFKWFRMAAGQGYASAQNNLGRMYAQGKGVPQDYVQAHKWLNLAASRTSGEGSLREMVAKEMTSDQIVEAQQLASEWKPKTWKELKAQAADQ